MLFLIIIIDWHFCFGSKNWRKSTSNSPVFSRGACISGNGIYEARSGASALYFKAEMKTKVQLFYNRQNRMRYIVLQMNKLALSVSDFGFFASVFYNAILQIDDVLFKGPFNHTYYNLVIPTRLIHCFSKLLDAYRLTWKMAFNN